MSVTQTQIAISGTQLQGVAFSTDKATAYVVSEGGNNLSYIDLATNAVTTTVTNVGSGGPIGLGLKSGYAYVANFGGQSGSTVSKVSLATNEITTISGFNQPFCVVSSPTLNQVYVGGFNGNVNVINTTNDEVDANIVCGGFLIGIAVSPDGSTVYTASNNGSVYAINTTTSVATPVATGIGSELNGVSVTPDGLQFWAVGGNVAKVYLTSDNSPVTTITVGTNPYYVAFSDDGLTAYVTNRDSSSLSVIDVATYTVSQTITTDFNGPTNIAVAGNTVLVSNGDNNLTKNIFGLPCFKKDSKILTINGYKCIQDLRKGDLVKTLLHDYVPVDMIGFSEMQHPASKTRVKDQLYKLTQDKYPELFEDLVLTGNHSVLVNDFKND
jgi:YVTN family beta-propeller protein